MIEKYPLTSTTTEQSDFLNALLTNLPPKITSRTDLRKFRTILLNIKGWKLEEKEFIDVAFPFDLGVLGNARFKQMVDQAQEFIPDELKIAKAAEMCTVDRNFVGQRANILERRLCTAVSEETCSTKGTLTISNSAKILERKLCSASTGPILVQHEESGLFAPRSGSNYTFNCFDPVLLEYISREISENAVFTRGFNRLSEEHISLLHGENEKGPLLDKRIFQPKNDSTTSPSQWAYFRRCCMFLGGEPNALQIYAIYGSRNQLGQEIERITSFLKLVGTFFTLKEAKELQEVDTFLPGCILIHQSPDVNLNVALQFCSIHPHISLITVGNGTLNLPTVQYQRILAKGLSHSARTSFIKNLLTSRNIAKFSDEIYRLARYFKDSSTAAIVESISCANPPKYPIPDPCKTIKRQWITYSRANTVPGSFLSDNIYEMAVHCDATLISHISSLVLTILTKG